MSPTPHPDANVQMVAQTLWDQCGVPEGMPPTSVCFDDAIVVLADLTAAGWRQVAAHLLPLLDLTADELDALRLAAAKYRAIDTKAPALNSALDKLTTTDTAEETS